jgi:phosphopantetheinyl transferase
VWRVALDLPVDRLRALEATLADDERTIAARHSNARLRDRFVARRGATREILARYAGGEPTGIEFERDDSGWPRVVRSDASIEFSVADSQGVALVAVAARSVGPVGVDVETVRRMDDAESIARDWFASEAFARYEAAESQSETARLEAFFSEWTRVEAAAKALGVGLPGIAERRAEVDRLAASALVFAPAASVIAALIPGVDPSQIGWWDGDALP